MGVLTLIWEGILASPFVVADELVMVFNLFVAGVAALAAGILALLPSFPDPPGPPSGVVGWLCWVVPLGSLLAGFAALVTCWVVYLGIRTVLKWVKAL